jgi:hypothetical protein
MSAIAMMRHRFDERPPQRFPTRTCEIVCTAAKGRPSYCIGGVPQVAGDKTRIPVGDARDLVSRGKARIVEGTEKVEML